MGSKPMKHTIEYIFKSCAVLLFIVWVLCSKAVNAQPARGVSLADEHLIKMYVDQLNKGLAINDITIDKPQDKPSDDHDSTDPRTEYHTGKVTYSTDGKFKIFIFEGESCGANCTTMYSGLMVLNTGKCVPLNYDPLPIDRIYALGDHQYLILQAGLSGGGNLIDDVIKANVIEMRGDKMIVRAFMNSRHRYSEAPFDFYAAQSQAIADLIKHYQKPRFTFNTKTNRLDYQYLKTNNGITSVNPGAVYLCKGYLNYLNGHMVFQKEIVRVLK